MKNRIKLLIYLLLIVIFNFKNALTENFEYTANKIKILENDKVSFKIPKKYNETK